MRVKIQDVLEDLKLKHTTEFDRSKTNVASKRKDLLIDNENKGTLNVISDTLMVEDTTEDDNVTFKQSYQHLDSKEAGVD